jgi:hypothetical protein
MPAELGVPVGDNVHAVQGDASAAPTPRRLIAVLRSQRTLAPPQRSARACAYSGKPARYQTTDGTPIADCAQHCLLRVRVLSLSHTRMHSECVQAASAAVAGSARGRGARRVQHALAIAEQMKSHRNLAIAIARRAHKRKSFTAFFELTSKFFRRV